MVNGYNIQCDVASGAVAAAWEEKSIRSLILILGNLIRMGPHHGPLEWLR